MTFGWAVSFQITREALRHLLALRLSQAAAQAPGGGSPAVVAALQAQISQIGAELRSLPLLDRAALQELKARCARELRAQAPPAPPPAAPAAHEVTLSPAESARIFAEYIWPALFQGEAVSGAPRAVVFGSQLGCAKASAMARAALELGGPQRVVSVMLEDLRPFHPSYAPLLRRNPRMAVQYTEPDVVRWLDMAARAAVSVRAPLVLEAGMRKAGQIVDLFGLLEAAGYDVEARALAVPYAVSWQNILAAQELSRQELGMTRTTTAGAHQATYDGLPVMLDHIEMQQLAATVTVYDRFGHCCYSHEPGTGRRTSPAPTAATELKIQRALPLDLQQLRRFHRTYAWVEEAVRAPGRCASYEELLQSESHRWEAECALLAEAFLQIPQQECLSEFPQLGNAFEILQRVQDSAHSLPDPAQRTLLAKRAAAGIARRIADGNLTTPVPW